MIFSAISYYFLLHRLCASTNQQDNPYLICLGVAFEQGKILRTPETVPFRLTRDLVDGMGVTGVEGVYRRCCEKTMGVMRSSQEALLTILEV